MQLQLLMDETRGLPSSGEVPEITDEIIQTVDRVAERFWRSRSNLLEIDEVKAQARFLLFRAIEKFRDDRGMSFKSWVQHKVPYLLRDWLREEGAPTLVRVPRLEFTRRKADGRNEADAVLRRHSIGELFTSKSGDEGLVTRLDPGVHDSNFEAADRRDLIRKLVRGLNSKVRAMVKMYYFEGYTMQEIGDRFGRSESRVSQCITNALAFMREVAEGIEGC